MALQQTLYGDIPHQILQYFAKTKLLVCDVDGVFSDGKIYLGNQGEELKAFNTKDGYGIKALAACGIDVAVITGRKSLIVEQRMQALNVKYIIQNTEDKATALAQLQKTYGYTKPQTVSIGDDMPDIGMFNQSCVGVAVADAHPYVHQQATWTTSLGGGKGAVRELCDMILLANGKLYQQHGASV